MKNGVLHLLYSKLGYINSFILYIEVSFVTNAMKTLKTTLDGKIDQPTSQGIEVKVSHLINVSFGLVIFCNYII